MSRTVAALAILLLPAQDPAADRKHDEAQRPRRMELVTLSLKGATMQEALDALDDRTDTTYFHFSDAPFDKTLRVTLDVRDAPLRKCLDLIEDQLKVTIRRNPGGQHQVTAKPAKRAPRTYAQGFTLETGLKRHGDTQWSAVLKNLGPCVTTLDSIEAFDPDRKPVEVARCGRCPEFFLLKSASPGPFRLRLKGRLVWESRYELKVTDPAKEQDFQVGSYEIRYAYPKLSWSCAEAVPERFFGRAEFDGRLKREFKNPGVFDMPGEKPRTRSADGWCACRQGPAEVGPPDPKRVREGRFTERYNPRPPAHFESMSVQFYKPIEEPFDTEVVIPAE